MGKLKTIGVIVLGLVIAGGWWATQRQVNAFNEYIKPLRPVLTAQDKLGETTSKANDAVVKASIAGWVKEAKALQAKIDAAAPKDPEVAAIHVHMKTQAKAFTEYFVAVEAIVGGDASAVPVRDKMIAARKAALDAFVKARTAHFEKHNITLDDSNT